MDRNTDEVDYYTYYVGEDRDDYIAPKGLVWNVFFESINKMKIVVFNIFNHYSFYNALIKINKKTSDNVQFIIEVRKVLMYYFWSKSEYEIILTSWPPYIEKNEIKRLNEENVQYRTTVNLICAEKVDIYTQIMLNWEAFKLYLIENRSKIRKTIIK